MTAAFGFSRDLQRVHVIKAASQNGNGIYEAIKQGNDRYFLLLYYCDRHFFFVIIFCRRNYFAQMSEVIATRETLSYKLWMSKKSTFDHFFSFEIFTLKF